MGKQAGKKGRKHGRKARAPTTLRRNDREIRRIRAAGGPKNAKERGFYSRKAMKASTFGA